MTTYQVLFFTANGKEGAFLYYVREPITTCDDAAVREIATGMCRTLAARLGVAVRARAEIWPTPGNPTRYIEDLARADAS